MSMRYLLVLSLALAACGNDRVIYIYADAGPQPDTGQPVDALSLDAGSDAALAPDGLCLPNRNPGSISSADCHRYAATPVCDAFTATCTHAPRAFCDACETDAQCQAGVDLHSRCVFMPRHGDLQGDQACLSPCVNDADCGFLGWLGATCRSVGSAPGTFCVVAFMDSYAEATCSDFMGGRR